MHDCALDNVIPYISGYSPNLQRLLVSPDANGTAENVASNLTAQSKELSLFIILVHGLQVNMQDVKTRRKRSNNRGYTTIMRMSRD